MMRLLINEQSHFIYLATNQKIGNIMIVFIINIDNIIYSDNKRGESFMNKVEIIMHPVRFKIIQVFLDGLSKTAKKVAKELKDVPQASLYRQLDTLVKAEVLIVTEENQIRGAVEKVYSLNVPAVNMTNDDLKEMTKEEHLQYFLFYTAQVTSDFEAYLDKGDIDFLRDGVGYRQVALHLSDTEFLDYIKDLRRVYEKYMQNTPASNRTKRIISTITIPKKEGELKHE